MTTSLPTFRENLDAIVIARLLTKDATDHNYDTSLIVTGDYGDRIGTLYAAAQPRGDSCWAIKEEAILNILRGLGQPRIMEAAISINITGYVASRLASQIVAVKGHEPLCFEVALALLSLLIRRCVFHFPDLFAPTANAFEYLFERNTGSRRFRAEIGGILAGS